MPVFGIPNFIKLRLTPGLSIADVCNNCHPLCRLASWTLVNCFVWYPMYFLPVYWSRRPTYPLWMREQDRWVFSEWVCNGRVFAWDWHCSQTVYLLIMSFKPCAWTTLHYYYNHHECREVLFYAATSEDYQDLLVYSSTVSVRMFLYEFILMSLSQLLTV